MTTADQQSHPNAPVEQGGVRFAELELAALDALSVEALALIVGSEERPLRGLAALVDWRLCGRLSRVLKSGFFRGDAGDALLVPAGGRLPVQRIFAFGCGAGEPPSEDAVREVLSRAFSALKRAGVTSVAFSLPVADAARAAAIARECAPAFSGQATLVVKDARRAASASVPAGGQASSAPPPEKASAATPARPHGTRVKHIGPAVPHPPPSPPKAPATPGGRRKK